MVVNLKNESQQIMDRKNEQLSQIMSQKRLIFQKISTIYELESILILVSDPKWPVRLNRCWWRMLETQCVDDN